MLQKYLSYCVVFLLMTEGTNLALSSVTSHQVRFMDTAAFPHIKPTAHIPDNMAEWSLCFWARPSHMKNTVFSYATKEHDNEILVMLPLLKNNTLSFKVFRRSNSNDGNSFDVRTKIEKGRWVHACITFSISQGSWEVFINGAMQASGKGVLPGQLIATGGVIVLGQDQDTIGGAFQENDSFCGDLALLHLWDRVLDKCEVASLANCSSTEEGNIISWSRTWMGLYNGAEIGPVALPCQRETSCKSHDSVTPL